MAETAPVFVEQNGFRNVVLRIPFVSADGSGIANQKIYDATSTGAFGVNKAGQNFFPGVHTTIVGLDYDAQDLKIRLQWQATTASDILALGNAPEDFSWRRFGGIRVPAGLTAPTGSILLSTISAKVGATFSLVLSLRKNCPTS